MLKAIKLNSEGFLEKPFTGSDLGLGGVLFFSEREVSVIGERDKEGNLIPDRKEIVYYLAPTGKSFTYVEDLRDYKSLEGELELKAAKAEMEDYEKAKAWAKTKIQGREAKNEAQRELLVKELMASDGGDIMLKVSPKFRPQLVAEAIKV